MLLISGLDSTRRGEALPDSSHLSSTPEPPRDLCQHIRTRPHLWACGQGALERTRQAQKLVRSLLLPSAVAELPLYPPHPLPPRPQGHPLCSECPSCPLRPLGSHGSFHGLSVDVAGAAGGGGRRPRVPGRPCGRGLPHSMATLFGLELRGAEVWGLHLQGQGC